MKRNLNFLAPVLLAAGSVSCSTFSEVYHSDSFYRPQNNTNPSSVRRVKPQTNTAPRRTPRAKTNTSTPTQTISSPSQKTMRRVESLSAPTTPSISAPTLPTKKAYPTAMPIAGKPGYVYNPYNNNPVFVEGIAAGKTVRDPKDPNTNHKFLLP